MEQTLAKAVLGGSGSTARWPWTTTCRPRGVPRPGRKRVRRLPPRRALTSPAQGVGPVHARLRRPAPAARAGTVAAAGSAALRVRPRCSSATLRVRTDFGFGRTAGRPSAALDHPRCPWSDALDDGGGGHRAASTHGDQSGDGILPLQFVQGGRHRPVRRCCPPGSQPMTPPLTLTRSGSGALPAGRRVLVVQPHRGGCIIVTGSGRRRRGGRGCAGGVAGPGHGSKQVRSRMYPRGCLPTTAAPAHRSTSRRASPRQRRAAWRCRRLSSRISAQAKGCRSGWPSSGRGAQYHVVTSSPGPTTARPVGAAPITGSYSNGGACTRPSAPPAPRMRKRPGRS